MHHDGILEPTTLNYAEHALSCSTAAIVVARWSRLTIETVPRTEEDQGNREALQLWAKSSLLSRFFPEREPLSEFLFHVPTDSKFLCKSYPGGKYVLWRSVVKATTTTNDL